MRWYRRLPKPAALSFDLDDTLYDNTPVMRRAEQALRAYLHQEWPATQSLAPSYWRDCRDHVLSRQPRLATDMGALRLHTLTHGLSLAGCKEPQLSRLVEDAFNHFYAVRSDFKVDKTICSLLSRCAQRWPLVAITNGNVNLKAIGIADYFDLCLHANLQQPMKPDGTMFTIAQQHLDLPAQHILHIGDNLEKDVMGARRAGYSTAWYAHNRPMSLQHEPVQVLPDIQLDTLDELLELA
ncbi:HAD-IA family hydrolase [Aestuariibacter halophilus]|uniref:HAD-IA family hydrolase n=1 Tax=Fluctibacter halophilus TaxID=226011 RepID=A0ABS8GAJ8_9ALTE|nr:HAD-IA family hydrolase [Aestuariibacter halophilus]MCC2617609.1 HAD-IA family hydrolase [Aestuariibacter halophilus]